jgi:hypothetical protein
MLYKIIASFESNIPGIYTTHVETCSEEVVLTKALQIVNYWWDIFSPNADLEHYKQFYEEKKSKTNHHDIFGLREFPGLDDEDLLFKLFVIDWEIDKLNELDEELNPDCDKREFYFRIGTC